MSRSTPDRLLAGAVRAAAGIAGLLVLVIGAFVLWRAWPALREIGPARFLTDPAWRPTGGEFLVAPMLAASVLVTAGAVGIAAPAGVACALFLEHTGPRRLAGPLRRLLELLNGVPSVLFGLWGLVTLAPLLARWEPPGQCLLAGILVLAVMILPTVALAADAAVRAVPRESLVAAASLGLSRLATIRHVVLPSARRGIAAGVLLGAARAVGETMAVVMVCGNVVRMPSGPFDPVRTVTANIALEMGYATEEHRAALFVTGLSLMALIGAAVWFLPAREEENGGAVVRTNA